MFKKIIRSFDYSIIVVYILLCLFGLVMIYSASMVTAVERYGYSSTHFYYRQLIFIAISFICFGGAAFFPYKAYKGNKVLGFIMIFSLFGLFALFVFGHISGGANSWLHIGPLSLEPGEFVKLSVTIYMAAVYSKKLGYIDNFNSGVAPPLIYLIVVCFLVLIQPDMGTAIIIFLIGTVIILCSGMKFKTILKLVSIVLIMLLALSPVLLIEQHKIFSGYQMARFTGFLSPFSTEGKEGYQLVNSFLAIGSGGIKGQGLGQSIQKLGYLPEPQTDFILAVIAEELGVFGVGFVIFGLAYLVLRGIYIGIKCRDPFGSLLAIGVSSWLAVQSFINIGGLTGMMPITGVPLPFISYGGSSLMVLSIAVGILVNVSMFTRYDERYKKKQDQPDSFTERRTYKNINMH
jgi:cell division protein FtsW